MLLKVVIELKISGIFSGVIMNSVLSGGVIINAPCSFNNYHFIILTVMIWGKLCVEAKKYFHEIRQQQFIVMTVL